MNGTKGKMAEAFKELVCKKSFQKITISDIAKESAMTRENFYYHKLGFTAVISPSSAFKYASSTVLFCSGSRL